MNNKYKNEIYKITLTSILTGLAILFGAFAKIPIFGGRYVFLMGCIILIFPLLLNYKYTIIGTTISVVMTDLLNAWIAYAWISFIAYVIGASVIYFFNNIYKFKKQINSFIVYLFSVLLGSLLMIFIYTFFTLVIWGKSMALNELLTDIIQFPIISLIAISSYKLIIKLKNISF